MIKEEFYTGKMFNAYDYFGAHIEKENNENGIRFTVYAPAATKVQVIGDFNGWYGGGYEMIEDGHSGVYSLFVKNAKVGMLYKYKIFGRDGVEIDKTDPYAFGMELRPNSASVITDLTKFQFDDIKWMKTRNKNYNKPLNIYEVHLGSWKRKSEEETGWYSYSEIADDLISYVKENGYTHIELMPICEYPCDDSWGYQTSGFFSPTSRYGKAAELMLLVNKCHKANIGVIIDFVVVHFVVDSFSLEKFDGTALYEYPDNDSGYSQWGSHNFNYYRGEVRSFLQSSANYWLSKYHFDGVRFDAISNVVYWQGNSNRGVNQGAVDFLKNMNNELHKLHPTAMLIAEDSTCFPKVTVPVEYGGLGFDYKWDMGWMNDTLNFFKLDPIYRKGSYGKLCFSMHYFYNELFLLPLSHDEVVHGKKTILNKIFGTYEEKFAQCRTLYIYMYMHPGKKLNFMGNELAQYHEWSEKKSVDWVLSKFPIHDGFHSFMMDLNNLYIHTKELYENEYDGNYFKWINLYDEYGCIYGFIRGKDSVQYLTVMNMGSIKYDDLHVSCGKFKEAIEIINSDTARYGGTGIINEKIKFDEKENDEIIIKLNEFSSTVIKLIK